MMRMDYAGSMQAVTARLAACLAACLALSPAAHAQSALPAAEDFAFAWPLQIKTDGDVVAVALPLDVYETATDPLLRDLAVFSADGKPLQFDIPAQRPRRDIAQWRALDAMALHGERDDALEGIELALNDDGATTELRLRRHQPAGPGERPLRAYVVDVRDLGGRVQRLEMHWPDSLDPFVGRVEVESSSDLARWQPAGAGAIASLAEGSSRLDRRTISIAPGAHDFLRLRWSGAPNGWRLLQLRGEIVAVQSEAARSWLELTAVDRSPEGVLYDAGAVLAVDAIDINVPEYSLLVRARVSTRPMPEQAWREVFNGHFFPARAADGLPADPVIIGTGRTRYFLLAANGLPPDVTPGLSVGWRPDELLFVPRGQAPFTLVAGHAASAASDFPLYREYREAELGEWWAGRRERALRRGQASSGARTALAGDAALAFHAPLDWQTILLWTLLVAGAGVSIWLGVGLLRQQSS